MIYDFYLVSSSLALLPTLKYYRLRSFSTIIFELPLDPFKVQFLVIINDIFVGPNVFDLLTCAKYLGMGLVLVWHEVHGSNPVTTILLGASTEPEPWHTDQFGGIWTRDLPFTTISTLPLYMPPQARYLL